MLREAEGKVKATEALGFRVRFRGGTYATSLCQDSLKGKHQYVVGF